MEWNEENEKLDYSFSQHNHCLACSIYSFIPRVIPRKSKLHIWKVPLHTELSLSVPWRMAQYLFCSAAKDSKKDWDTTIPGKSERTWGPRWNNTFVLNTATGTLTSFLRLQTSLGWMLFQDCGKKQRLNFGEITNTRQIIVLCLSLIILLISIRH